jgi:hypothetical protein
MKLATFNDVEFAQYLYSFGNDWTFKAIQEEPPFTEFYAPDKSLVALVIYNNQTCDRWIYIPE